MLNDAAPSAIEEVNLGAIIDVKFAVKSDVKINNVEFYMLLHEWGKRGIDFQIFFDDPQYVSKGM